VSDLKYTNDHEWIRVEGDIGTVGISDFAQEIYAPVSGEVIEVNTSLEDDSSLVNSDPVGKGWFFKIRLSNAGELDGLMDEDAYKTFTEEQD